MNTEPEIVTTVRGDGLLSHKGPIETSGRVIISPTFKSAYDSELSELNVLSLDTRLSEPGATAATTLVSVNKL